MKKFLAILFSLFLICPVQVQAATAYPEIGFSGITDYYLGETTTKIGNYYYTDCDGDIFRGKKKDGYKLHSKRPILVDVYDIVTDGSSLYYLRFANEGYYLYKSSLNGKKIKLITEIKHENFKDIHFYGMYKNKIYASVSSKQNADKFGYFELKDDKLKFHKTPLKGIIIQGCKNYFICGIDKVWAPEPLRLFVYNTKTDKRHKLCENGAYPIYFENKLYYVDKLKEGNTRKINIVKCNPDGSSKKVLKTITSPEHTSISVRDLTEDYIEYHVNLTGEHKGTETYRCYYKTGHTVRLNE